MHTCRNMLLNFYGNFEQKRKLKTDVGQAQKVDLKVTSSLLSCCGRVASKIGAGVLESAEPIEICYVNGIQS